MHPLVLGFLTQLLTQLVSVFTSCVYFLGADAFNQTSLNNSLVSLFEKFIAAIFYSFIRAGFKQNLVVAR